MIAPAVVTIVVDGSFLSSFAPARVRGGRVVAPLMPTVARLADRAQYVPASATVVVERARRRVVVPVAFVEHSVPYVGLAAVVRGIGGEATFDTETKTLVINFPVDNPIATSAPFDPRAPGVAPTAVFAEPTRPEPRPGLATGLPRPRRTAVPVVPSQPGAAGPQPVSTDPRRRGS